MTRDEAISEVQRVLGYRSDKVAEIQSLLLYQQAEMERQSDLPWFLRTELDTIVSIANNPNIAVPTGFLKEWQEDPLALKVWNNSNTAQIWRELAKDSPNFLRTTLQEVSDTATGIPVAYSRVGDNFVLFPTPNAIFTFRMTYYKEDAVLSTNIENKWLKHLPYLLIGRCGLRVSGAMRDKDAMQSFGLMVQESMARINTWNTELDEAGVRRVVGGPD